MRQPVDIQAKKFEEAKARRKEIRDSIMDCNRGLTLLRKGGQIVVGKPWFTISVNDKYKDDNSSAKAEIVIKRPVPEAIIAVTRILENEKKRLQAELNNLEKQYSF